MPTPNPDVESRAEDRTEVRRGEERRRRPVADDEYVDPRAMVLEELWEDEVYGPQVQALVKKKWPKAKIREYDLRTSVTKELDDLRKERQEEKAARAKEQEQQQLAAERQALLDEGLLDDASEIPEVEKVMRDHLIADHRTAARFYRDVLQAAAPRPAPLELAHGKEYEGVYKDVRGWRQKRAYDVLAELQRQPRRRRTA